jgi:hypothetical protein
MSALRVLERSEAAQGTFSYYHALYMAKHQATNEAWIAEMQAAKALQDSDTWQETGCKTWQEFCAIHMPYKASTYRAYRLNIPIAEIVESVTNVALDKNGARKLREKIAEVVEDADAAIIPAIWQLCHVYDSSKLIPDKHVIEEAYEIIKEERDSNTLNVAGETINVKELAQKFRIKERVVQNIQAHSTKVGIVITLKRVNGAWQVTADGDLPDVVEITYWRKESGN